LSGNYILVGAFDAINNKPINNIAMISSQWVLDANYGPMVNGSIESILVLVDGQYIIRWDFTIVDWVQAKGIALLWNQQSILSFNNTYIWLASWSIQVWWRSTIVVIELRDVNNQIYTWDIDLQFSISAGSITWLSVYPGVPWRYMAKILSPNKVWSATIQVRLNNTMLLQTQTIKYTAWPCDANNSIINLSPTSLIADGKSSALGLIQCRDAWNNPTSYGMTQVTSSAGQLSPLIHKWDWNYAFTITSATTSTVGFVNFTTQTSTKSEGIRFGTICELVDIPQHECKGLIDLYQNNNWTNRHNQQGWLRSPNINDRYGVDAVSWHIAELDLSNNNLAWVVSPTLSQLSKLSHLNLSKNLLKDADVVWLMTGLVKLDLSYNLLNRIPQILGQCKLTQLNMDYNILTSTIPAWLERCTELTDLSLSHNQMIWKLPSELSSLKFLNYLSVDNNHFDRDDLNYALLETPLAQVAQLNWQEQNDTSVPLISNVTVTWSNVWLSYNIVFTIEENSYFSWEEDDTLITQRWWKAVLTWWIWCSSIALSPVKYHNGTTSVAVYANQHWIYEWCVLYVYDRAWNQSNGALISPMTFDYPALRLRLSAWDGILVESWFVAYRYDQSLLQNQFEGEQLSMPRYTQDLINWHPVISFDQGRYLMWQWLVSNSLGTQIDIYAVIQNKWTNSPWYTQYYNIDQLVNPLYSWSKFISVNTSNDIWLDPYILRTLYTSDGINHMSINSSKITATWIVLNSWWIWITDTILWDFDGNIAEVMIYIDPKTSYDTSAIQTYLAIKYSITQATGFIYVKSDGSSIWNTASSGKDYSNHIFWIGKDQLFKLDQTTSINKMGVRIESSIPLIPKQYVLVGDNNGDLDRDQDLSWWNVYDREYYITTTIPSQINLKFPVSILGSIDSSIIYQLSPNQFFDIISQSWAVWYDTSSNMSVISWLTLSWSSYMRLIKLEGSLSYNALTDQVVAIQSIPRQWILMRITRRIIDARSYVVDSIAKLF